MEGYDEILFVCDVMHIVVLCVYMVVVVCDIIVDLAFPLCFDLCWNIWRVWMARQISDTERRYFQKHAPSRREQCQCGSKTTNLQKKKHTHTCTYTIKYTISLTRSFQPPSSSPKNSAPVPNIPWNLLRWNCITSPHPECAYWDEFEERFVCQGRE